MFQGRSSHAFSPADSTHNLWTRQRPAKNGARKPVLKGLGKYTFDLLAITSDVSQPTKLDTVQLNPSSVSLNKFSHPQNSLS
jgi:hypothetical protein